MHISRTVATVHMLEALGECRIVSFHWSCCKLARVACPSTSRVRNHMRIQPDIHRSLSVISMNFGSGLDSS